MHLRFFCVLVYSEAGDERSAAEPLPRNAKFRIAHRRDPGLARARARTTRFGACIKHQAITRRHKDPTRSVSTNAGLLMTALRTRFKIDPVVNWRGRIIISA